MLLFQLNIIYFLFYGRANYSCCEFLQFHINPSANAANFNSSVFFVLFILFRMKNLHDSLLSWVTEEVERSVLKSSSFVTIVLFSNRTGASGCDGRAHGIV